MSIKVCLTSVTFSNSETIDFKENTLTLIVGPNNAGKSAFLREIFNTLQNGKTAANETAKVTNNVQLITEGSEEDLEKFLALNTQESRSPQGEIMLGSLNVPFQVKDNFIYGWKNILLKGFQSTINLYCNLVNTQDKLSITQPPPQINLLSDVPTHPIHILQKEDETAEKLSRYAALAFGEDLVLNKGAGSIVPLHFGKKPEKTENEESTSTSYLKKLVLLPGLYDQGDGIKSFVGCLLQSIILPKFITLVDEPEAFLHPPQAKLLGSNLAKEHKNNSGQLILETHSGDLLKGILQENKNDLSILRITRKNNQNRGIQLDAEDIKKLWANPVLRFSNVLEGLFHEAVIICEAEADCYFYSAIMTYLYDESEKKKRPDIHFIAAGGKDRIPLIVEALHKIELPVKTVLDFDVLRDESKIKKLYESLGGTWSSIEKNYKEVKAAIENNASLPTEDEIISVLNKIVTDVKDCKKLEDFYKDKLREIIKKPSCWTQAKKYGINAVSPGGPTNLVWALIEDFKEIGLWIVPGGELESFDKTVSGHGREWLAKVIDKIDKKGIFIPRLKGAREFVKTLTNF